MRGLTVCADALVRRVSLLRWTGWVTVCLPDVLAGFLRELGIKGLDIPEDLDERGRMYRALLAGRRVLVVLDNAADEAQVRPLLPGSAGCAVLVTARSRLAGLAGARPVRLDVMPPGQVIQLLRNMIGEERARSEPTALDDIARRQPGTTHPTGSAMPRPCATGKASPTPEKAAGY
jgi:hypothetical protein